MGADLLLGPMLRYVSDDEATVWVETSTSCEVKVLDTVTPTFTVGGHHFALVILRDLPPRSVIEYEVHLDGRRTWPEVDSRFPPSVIRTNGGNETVRVLFGSCRAAAPHEPPYDLSADQSDEARGVDALRTNGLRMIDQDPSEWPDVLVLLGDQVYADEASPGAERRIKAREAQDGAGADIPPHVVANFEEYTWLYEESWQPDVERWVFSVLPTTMIFDDHDVIDDWNISAPWVEATRAEAWWEEHIIGAMMSYWVYQHLGNLSPDRLREDGLLAAIEATGDGTGVLRKWAYASDSSTLLPGGYFFSFSRRFGAVQLVTIDVRNGRVLTPGHRQMVADAEWDWVVEQCRQPCDHLIIVTSLPVFAPGGIHAIQQWNEAICDGRWGATASKVGEWIRRQLDMEDWASFNRSFRAMEELLIERGDRNAYPPPPSTITILSGDIHFSYVLPIQPRSSAALQSRVYQLVSSPIRHILPRRERNVLRVGESPVGRRVAELLQRLGGRPKSSMKWALDDDPLFDNAMSLLELTGDQATFLLERSFHDDAGKESLEIVRRRSL